MSVQILVGDCRERLAELPDESVHCCVTSPPYYGLRDYGVDGQLGLEETPDAYVQGLVEVFREVRRVLRDDGTLWLNLGDSYANDGKWGGSSGGKHVGALHGGTGIGRQKVTTGLKPKDLIGIPWRVAFALQADGWWLRSDIIWHKPNPMPESVRDRPTSAHEHVFLLAKSERYSYDADAIREAFADDRMGRDGSVQDSERDRGGRSDGFTKPNGIDPSANGGRNARNVWTITTKPFGEAHFAVFPPELAERCVKAGTPDPGGCPECGAPWERVVERRDPKATGAATGGDPARADGGVRERDPSGAGGNRLARTRTAGGGWSPTCEHEAEPVPCTVLDPFGGAGTTGLVADRLDRDAILIELNPEYAAMAERRIYGDAPLFVDVEAL